MGEIRTSSKQEPLTAAYMLFMNYCGANVLPHNKIALAAIKI